MSTFFPKTLSVARVSGSYDSIGRWTPGTPQPIAVEGSVQPMTAAQVAQVSQGRQSSGMVSIFTDAVLQVAVEGGNNPGDILTWFDYKWEVIQKMPYDNDLIPHLEYIAENRGQA